MSKLTYQQAIELVRSIAPGGALGWTVRSEKNNRGDYGFDWTFYDACRKRTDVASLLRETAIAILQKRLDPNCGKIHDRNGNTVGEWSF